MRKLSGRHWIDRWFSAREVVSKLAWGKFHPIGIGETATEVLPCDGPVFVRTFGPDDEVSVRREFKLARQIFAD
jgi:hypothetical protein